MRSKNLKIMIAVICVVVPVTLHTSLFSAFTAEKRYYEYPDITTIPDAGRILMYDGSSSKNITGSTLKSLFPNLSSASQITGLATVATTGSYTDLSNKPTIPVLDNYTGHQLRRDNPHGVTAAQAGAALDTHHHAPVTYNPTILTVQNGTLDAGTVADLSAVGGTTVSIAEVNGSPALRAQLTYTGPADVNNVVLYGRYLGGAGHNVAVQVWNVATSTWDTLGLIATSTTNLWYSYPIINGADYLNAGTLLLRFEHLQNGISSHDLYLDYVVVRHSSDATGGGVTDHGALTGLIDHDDHSQYALTDGTRGEFIAKTSPPTGQTITGGPLTVKGSGTGNTTYSLILKDSAGTNRLTVRDDGVIDFGSGSLYTTGSVNATTYQPSGNNTTMKLLATRAFTSVMSSLELLGGAISTTSGANTGVTIKPLYNQTSGTASNTDLLINRTETAVGSGIQRLISAQVGGVERFGVSNTGAITATSINAIVDGGTW